MAPTEFHRYTDNRGDTVIYKFDAQVARNPDPKWPNDSPITVYQHYIITKRNGTANYHSDLLPLDLAIERSRLDKPASQPIIGKVMYTESAPSDASANATTKTQYVWKGWSYGEGYRRGWAKLYVRGFGRAPPLLRVVRAQSQRDIVFVTGKAKVLSPVSFKTRPSRELVKWNLVGKECVEEFEAEKSNGTSTSVEVSSEARRDTNLFSTSSKGTETASHSHNLEEENESQPEPEPLANLDVATDLQHLFAEMPMLLYAVEKTGGLGQFRASLTNPKAIQIFESFISKFTGAAPLTEKRTILKGKKWDYWVIKYKVQLTV